MREGALRVSVGALALAGAGITAYLTYERYAGGPIACAIGGCETVLDSRYAAIGPVPVSALGLAGYVLVLLGALAPGRTAAAAGAALAASGLAFSLYLLVVQIAVIEQICQWCVASDGVIALIALLSLARLRAETPAATSSAPT